MACEQRGHLKVLLGKKGPQCWSWRKFGEVCQRLILLLSTLVLLFISEIRHLIARLDLDDDPGLLILAASTSKVLRLQAHHRAQLVCGWRWSQCSPLHPAPFKSFNSSLKKAFRFLVYI